MADREAADRLKRALKVGMAAAGVDGWIALAFAAKVSPTTLENWIYGRTTPRAKELAKVAAVLRPYMTPAELESAYYGTEPAEPPITEALRELLPELRELVILLRAQADQAILEEVRAALEARRRAGGRSLDEPPSEASS